MIRRDAARYVSAGRSLKQAFADYDNQAQHLAEYVTLSVKLNGSDCSC